MANNIELAQKYLPEIDLVYKAVAKSALLDAPAEMVGKWLDANTIKIAKRVFPKLGNYSKADGYPQGGVTVNWETFTFTNDRGRAFNIDKMDNMESMGVALLNTVGDYMREIVIPEKDAYAFARIAGTEGIQGATGTLTNANTKQAINAARVALANKEVDEANLVLFITPDALNNLEEQIDRGLRSGETAYGQKIRFYNDIPVVVVPPTRFYDKVDLLDAKTSGQEEGGYRKHVASGTGDVAGKDINFILMDKNAAFTLPKNNVTKIITPQDNQLYDGWTFHFRFYHETFVYENKKSGIFVHRSN